MQTACSRGCTLGWGSSSQWRVIPKKRLICKLSAGNIPGDGGWEMRAIGHTSQPSLLEPAFLFPCCLAAMACVQELAQLIIFSKDLQSYLRIQRRKCVSIHIGCSNSKHNCLLWFIGIVTGQNIVTQLPSVPVSWTFSNPAWISGWFCEFLISF